MSIVGRIESVWRYPVKSMAGESLPDAFLGYAGVYGDRLYAFHDGRAQAGFPFLTGREQAQMLLCRPRFRHAEHATRPANLQAAEATAPGATPLYPTTEELAVEVETPSGSVISVDDPALIDWLRDGLPGQHEVSLRRSHRAMTDCRPVSLFSLQTAAQLGEEVGRAIDKRRFRANLYADLDAAFAENGFVGKRLRVGAKAVVAVLERDPRCKMITLDPDTGEADPNVLRRVAREHEGMAGVYGAVLTEGTVMPGDAIELLD